MPGKQKSLMISGCRNKIVETKLLKIAYWKTQLPSHTKLCHHSYILVIVTFFSDGK